MDGFLKEIGVSISFNFGRSSPIVILCRFQSFDAYAWVLVVGYGGGAEKNKNCEKITLAKAKTASMIWSPARFSGEHLL